MGPRTEAVVIEPTQSIYSTGGGLVPQSEERGLDSEHAKNGLKNATRKKENVLLIFMVTHSRGSYLTTTAL